MRNNWLELHIDCNDDRGETRIAVNAIVLARGDRYPIISLNSSLGVAFEYKGDACSIGEISISFANRHPWYGSMKWDMLEIDPKNAIALLDYCQKLNRAENNRFWACEEAESEICQVWKNGAFGDFAIDKIL